MGGVHKKNCKQAQWGANRATHAYMVYQDLIFDEAGVSCTVVLKNGFISIRTRDLAEYYLAKSVLKKRCSTPIMRDVMHDDKIK